MILVIIFIKYKDKSKTMQFPFRFTLWIYWFIVLRLIFLARYQQEFDKGVSKAAAERFYHQAIALYPDNGKLVCKFTSLITDGKLSLLWLPFCTSPVVNSHHCYICQIHNIGRKTVCCEDSLVDNVTL